jgi:tetratricopeptide (TPR) repeat protein
VNRPIFIRNSVVLFLILAFFSSADVRGQGPQAEAASQAPPGSEHIALAEKALRQGETQIAESEYKAAAAESAAMLGLLYMQEKDVANAKRAYELAVASVSHPEEYQITLGLFLMQSGEPEKAESTARAVLSVAPKNVKARQVAAEALSLQGKTEEAIQELTEAKGLAPDDIGLLYAIGTGYLRANKLPEAQKTFAEILKLRPIPETHVLLGRTYRDFSKFELAQQELQTALKSGKKLRRAHYYLGTISLLNAGIRNLDLAIQEFKSELEWYPDEDFVHLSLGMALVEQRNYAEAIPHLERGINGSSQATTFQLLGKAYLNTGNPEQAKENLQKALTLLEAGKQDLQQISAVHYLLAQALKKVGDNQGAEEHFRLSQQTKSADVQETRETLKQYLAGETKLGQQTSLNLLDLSGLEALTEAQRRQLKEAMLTNVARAESNLGVLRAQAQDFAHAADYFKNAADAIPDFPDVEYSLGLSYFNSQQFQQAIAPLQRAITSDAKRTAEIQRVLALCYLNTEQYSKAASLLAIDDGRREDVSLEYAYALALVRSNQIKEAEQEFAYLLSRHADSPELNVLIGQAHAQESDFDSAIPYFQKALQQKADVKEAHSALGIIYMRQGKLEDAERELRAELQLGPNPTVEFQLANVLDLRQKTDEAKDLLEHVLKQKPDLADARYLLGKILLARGQAQQASENLEAAARISPEEPNVHYQLAQAYQKLGKSEEARQEFELFRKYKAEQRRPQ